MNKIFLVLGLVFVVATILFSGCVTTDSSNTTKDSTNNNLTDNTNANGNDNLSNDLTQPPAFPSD